MSDILVLCGVYVTLGKAHLPVWEVFEHLNLADPHLQRIARSVDWVIVPWIVLIGLFFLKGHYSRRRLFWDDVRETGKLVLIVGIIDLAILQYDGPHRSIATSLAVWGPLALLLTMGRYVAKRALLLAGVWQIPTRILGSGANASLAYLTLKHEPILGYTVDAFINIAGHPRDLPEGLEKVPLVEYSHDENLETNFIAGRSVFSHYHIVIALEQAVDDSVAHVVNVLTAHGHQVDVVPSFRGLPLVGMEVSHVFGREAVILHARNVLSRPVLRGMKMAFDLALALVTLVIMFPVMAAIACCIKAEDGGPVLFRQQRVGRNGRMFDCLKFRTMTVDAEQIFEAWRKEGGDQWKAYVAGNFKLKNDPRVTKVGRFLRSSSLDELPQIFNVLRGEMSLVGPRPMQYRETQIVKERQVHYRRVRPGITGIWQISGRSETSFAERLAYDEWYCKNWSLWGDLVIIIKTISVLIGRKGAY